MDPHRREELLRKARQRKRDSLSPGKVGPLLAASFSPSSSLGSPFLAGSSPIRSRFARGGGGSPARALSPEPGASGSFLVRELQSQLELKDAEVHAAAQRSEYLEANMGRVSLENAQLSERLERAEVRAGDLSAANDELAERGDEETRRAGQLAAAAAGAREHHAEWQGRTDGLHRELEGERQHVETLQLQVDSLAQELRSAEQRLTLCNQRARESREETRHAKEQGRQAREDALNEAEGANQQLSKLERDLRSKRESSTRSREQTLTAEEESRQIRAAADQSIGAKDRELAALRETHGAQVAENARLRARFEQSSQSALQSHLPSQDGDRMVAQLSQELLQSRRRVAQLEAAGGAAAGRLPEDGARIDCAAAHIARQLERAEMLVQMASRLGPKGSTSLAAAPSSASLPQPAGSAGPIESAQRIAAQRIAASESAVATAHTETNAVQDEAARLRRELAQLRTSANSRDQERASDAASLGAAREELRMLQFQLQTSQAGGQGTAKLEAEVQTLRTAVHRTYLLTCGPAGSEGQAYAVDEGDTERQLVALAEQVDTLQGGLSSSLEETAALAAAKDGQGRELTKLAVLLRNIDEELKRGNEELRQAAAEKTTLTAAKRAADVRVADAEGRIRTAIRQQHENAKALRLAHSAREDQEAVLRKSQARSKELVRYAACCCVPQLPRPALTPAARRRSCWRGWRSASSP